MGVSGSGKTTTASRLAAELGWAFLDGDDLHSAENICKMASGMPLTDEDRWPWLRSIAAWIDAAGQAGRSGVVACSALKRSYRKILLDGRPNVRLVYLQADPATLAPRVAARQGHFMPATLLRSQFETLEEPKPDEHPIVVSAEPPPSVIVAEILKEIETPA